MKKILIAAVSALAFAASSAQAQTSPVDPAAAAAVQDLLVSMKYRELMRQSFAQMEQSMPAMMLEGAKATINGNAKLTAAQKKDAIDKAAKALPAVAESFNAIFRDPKLLDELLAEIVPMYARYFTAAEIGELAAFYKTPLGAKMLATMPQLQHESMLLSQKVVMPRVTEAIGKLVDGKECCNK